MENSITLNAVIQEFYGEGSDDGKAFAEVSKNPNFQWVSLIVCDDLPNGNRQRIPTEEFDNLITTGLYTPVKMAMGGASGHKEAKGRAIGVISGLAKDGNALKAIAALWTEERREDIIALRDSWQKGELPQVSFEVGYTVEEQEEDWTNLRNAVLNGVSVVANPAYRGRTPINAFAEEINVEVSVEDFEVKFAELTEKYATLEALAEELKTKLESVEAEKSVLAEFKKSIDDENQRKDSIASLRSKFANANIARSEEYWQNAETVETLLKLGERELDFHIQELVQFSATKDAQASMSNEMKVPNLGAEVKNLSNPRVLAAELRAAKNR